MRVIKHQNPREAVVPQNPTGHSLEQSAVGDPARAGQPNCQPQLISHAVTLSQQRIGSFKNSYTAQIYSKDFTQPLWKWGHIK